MLKNKPEHTLELLAPAGTVEVFETAVAQGADAVYIGAPALNARALARNFSMAELAAMIDYGHRQKVKVYLAMNSLMREDEITAAVELLARLEALRADALIIQDLGVYNLARKYFPGLRLHASTLLTAHNSLAVRQFAAMGFERVVLAREMTLAEIEAAHRQSAVELEVFVHGAMCFSYSGLCLFSSYLGGKSGLRGRCVQPCRRRYTWAGKGRGHRSGYLFSMQDLSAVDLVDRLRQAGVSSLKIEGRMRSAHYVGSVVKAYRLVLDAAPGDRQALDEAEALLRQAMGRKTTPGFFLSRQPEGVLAPQHSGNIGLFLGRIERARGRLASVTLNEPVEKGDRLRAHSEQSGERVPFSVQQLRFRGKEVAEGRRGQSVELELPSPAAVGDSLYKVDVRQRRQRPHNRIQPARFQKQAAKPLARARIDRILAEVVKARKPGRPPAQPHGRHHGQRAVALQGRGGRGTGQPPLAWWLRCDDLQLLKDQLPLPPARIAVTLTPETFSQYARMAKLAYARRRNLVWALPPVIDEEHVAFYGDAIERLVHDGYTAWQLGHVSQILFFKGKPRCAIYGDYTLNALNSQALAVLHALGLKSAQAAIETDRDNLAALCQVRPRLPVGLTVYGLPPLFIARAAADYFDYDRPFVSPKGETFILKRSFGQTVAVPDKPFSLLPFLAEIAALGVQYAVLDISRMRLRRGGAGSVVRQLLRPAKGKRLSTFNFRGSLQ